MKNGEIYEISFWLLVVGDKFNAGKIRMAIGV